jgi:hypothetical protein
LARWYAQGARKTLKDGNPHREISHDEIVDTIYGYLNLGKKHEIFRSLVERATNMLKGGTGEDTVQG